MDSWAQNAHMFIFRVRVKVSCENELDIKGSFKCPFAFTLSVVAPDRSNDQMCSESEAAKLSPNVKTCCYYKTRIGICAAQFINVSKQVIYW